MINLFTFLKNLFQQKRLKAEYEKQEEQKRVDAFVDQMLLPDMEYRGFKFGRKACAEYVRSLGVSSFDVLDRLSVEITESAMKHDGIGPKVAVAFRSYLQARADLKKVNNEQPTEDS